MKADFHGTDGAGKDGPMAALGPKLIRLYHAHQQQKAQGRTGPVARDVPRMPLVGRDHVVVDAVARKDARALADDLQTLGMHNVAVAGRIVSGRLPIASLDDAARLASLHSAAPALASTGVGATTSQGDVALYADSTRASFGTDGTGVKTCALSDSYNNASDPPRTTAPGDVQTGDLPGSGNPNGYTTPVDVVAEAVDPSGNRGLIDEGRAMLQIIHDVAPGAPLGFHTSVGGIANFARGVRELAEAGCSVIVDDYIYFAQPMYQDGQMTQAIEAVVQENDVAYFTAAGNAGSTSYEAPFRDAQPAADVVDGVSGTLHDFAPGSAVDPRQEIVIQPGGTALLTLQWSDPFFRVSGPPGADTDLDLYLLDGDQVAARSERRNIGGDPWEIVVLENDTDQPRTVDVAIALRSGPAPDRLKYAGSWGSSSITIEEYATESGTAWGHHDAASAFSTGAVLWSLTPRLPDDSSLPPTQPPFVNRFSSRGGIPVLFDTDGQRLSPPVVRAKPDFTAPDGGNTTFFGNDQQFDPDNFPNFFGTSAAAPHAAAVGALMRSLQPELSPQEMGEQLQESAVDIVERFGVFSGGVVEPIPDGEGPDIFSGAGLIRADRAVASLLSARVVAFQGTGAAPGDAPTATVTLNWETTRERDSRGFVVERHAGRLTPEERGKAETWTRVGFAPSKAPDGASTGTLQYAFNASVPSPGRYTFRLRHATGEDGSDPRSVGAITETNVPIGGSFALGGPQPNPFQQSATLEVVTDETQAVRIELFDTLGRRVRVLYDRPLQAGEPLLLPIDAGGLSSGLYFLRIDGDTFTETRRAAVVK